MSTLTVLEALHLDHNSFRQLGDPSIVSKLANLQVLGLSFNNLEPAQVPMGLAAALPQLIELRL
jgi:Leucine-rich repeat (LRR) protein